jgi:hypothetical protein
MYKLLVIGLVFLLGFYFIYKSNDIEAFTTDIGEKCPDILIQKGAAFFLYNSKRANVPGVNPIRFENLEEYVEFTEWQRSKGILCPILYLQHAYNAQGEPVYKARPSPTNLQAGQPDYVVTQDSLRHLMPPPDKVPVQGLYGRDSIVPPIAPPIAPQMMPPIAPPNVMQSPPNGMQSPPNGMPALNNYTGFDPTNQPEPCLDKMFSQTSGVSPNPMDTNWGGVEYTEKLVESGYYKA